MCGILFVLFYSKYERYRVAELPTWLQMKNHCLNYNRGGGFHCFQTGPEACLKTKLCGLSPRTNYTDQARLSVKLVPTFCR
jgi:hypothetical protein